MNKQGRSEEELTYDQKQKVLSLLSAGYATDYRTYHEFLDMGLARELARIGLSLANYTEWYWKIDLHNLFHFLKLRMDKRAMYELRIYAEAMAQIVKDAVPLCFEAFEDYQLYAMQLSHPEQEFIKNHAWPMKASDAAAIIREQFQNKRETEEFVEKLIALGFLSTS